VNAVRRVRVELPPHLRTLAQVNREVVVEVPGEPTIGSLLDALEASYPVLCGAIRDHGTLRRRPFVRYFACAEDLSHDPATTPLPQAIVEGKEAFLVVGAIAGG
jgi:molybdopterin synthase sulfur carrier subunit